MRAASIDLDGVSLTPRQANQTIDQFQIEIITFMNNPQEHDRKERQYMNISYGRSILCLFLLAMGGLWSSCTTPGSSSSKTPEVTPTLQTNAAIAQVESLYGEGRYEEAIDLCIALSAQNPDMPGLNEWRNRVLSALADQRTERLASREDLNRNRAALDNMEKMDLPDTYGLRRFVEGLPSGSLNPDSPMRKVMEQPVTLSLKNAPLSSLIQALSLDDQINMIADHDVGQGQTLDIEVTDVPLREVLDYITRNYPVQFYIGERIIWVTSHDPKRTAPLETRIFRLRKGLMFHGLGWGPPPKDQLTQSDISTLTRKATVPANEGTYLETIIEKFTPPVEGARLHVDFNTHTLFVRNTRDNLAVIADIVEALDVVPPQVLIEARFIEVSLSDLREIGIDWILGSPLTVSKKGVLGEDGTWTRQPRTVIDQGASISSTPYTSDGAGAFPLGPQGPFGLLRQGNPPTASQGLNLTYRGLLTEPMFTAVLHALEISGKGRTLSVPRVTTLNNNPAKLRDGDDLLYYEEFQAQAFALVDANNQKYTVTALIPKGTPKVAELGFTLVAVPSVGADLRTINLLLTPTISELLEFISYQDDAQVEDEENQRIQQVVVKLPRIARREVQTKVVVDSGETVVMGGLIRTVSQDTVHRVPILGSLPIIGGLFRRTDVTEDRRNLLIFVTATVISERGESLVPLPLEPSVAMP